MGWIKVSLLLLFVLIEQSVVQNIRSIEMSVMSGWQFQCASTICSPFITVILSNIVNCQLSCLAQVQCQAISFHQSTSQCELFGDISNQISNMVLNTDIVTMITMTGTRNPSVSEINLLINGDAEMGPCESGSGVTHPTVWTYSGTITQVYYNNYYANQMSTYPGPSDRGSCHFYGQNSAATTMWQTIYMTNSISPLLIDNQTVWFNFSAWIGGYANQDDNAQVSLTFQDQANQQVGNSTTLGPVLAADRSNITSLLFRQANGLVPIGARSCIVLVTMTRFAGTADDGDIDNIAFFLYQ